MVWPKLFPNSLRDDAQTWLDSLSESIKDWNDRVEKFLMNYFTPSKNAKYISDINNLQQFAGKPTASHGRGLKGCCKDAHIMESQGVSR